MVAAHQRETRTALAHYADPVAGNDLAGRRARSIALSNSIGVVDQFLIIINWKLKDIGAFLCL